MTTISSKKKERTVSASTFEATCLELMNRVQANGIVVRVTKHGKPIARLLDYPFVTRDKHILNFVRSSGAVVAIGC
jgi:prevent-host-death family protein